MPTSRVHGRGARRKGLRGRRRMLAGALAAGLSLLALAWLLPFGGGAHPLRFLGSYGWRMPDEPLFGGFSALELSDGGTAFLAISDRAAFFRGRIRRDEGGRIVGIAQVEVVHPVSDLHIRLDRLNSDMEGLALLDDGRFYISLEGHHALNLFLPGDPEARWVETGGIFDDLAPKRGLEALATDPEGRLIAIPEAPPKGQADFPVYRLSKDGRWSIPSRIARRGGYYVTGADLGPDGRLYLLERKTIWPLGFSSRVRSFAFGPDGLEDERLLLRTRLRRHDNLEGISVWRDAGGDIRITLISDDNFSRFQKTELVEYALPARPSAP